MLTKFIKQIQFKNRQRQINKKFKENGATDEVMQLQIELNTERNRTDISDPSKKVHKNYVQ